MSTLQQIAVSTKLFRQLESLARSRGVSVTRVVEPVLVAGIESVKEGREIVIDVGKPEAVLSKRPDPLTESAGRA